jgi:hypothetical protein
MVAGALLALVWLAVPGRHLPLYDGVGFPDEPYRWVVPTGPITTSPPTSASTRVAISGGVSADVDARSAEQGPQVAVWVLRGGLQAPAGATSATIRVEPIVPLPAPAGGTLVSNIYRVTAQTPAGPASLTAGSGQRAAIVLRAVSAMTPEPVVQRYADGRWTALSTHRLGQDVWGAQLTMFGDYALIKPGADSATPAAQGSPVSSAGSGNGIRVLLICTGVAVLALALVILAIRRTRRALGPKSR